MANGGFVYVLDLHTSHQQLCTNTVVQIWEYFLAYSTIMSRQGGATCYQITLVKNLNSTHRIEGIHNHFGLSGALNAAKFDLKSWQEANASLFPSIPTQ